MGPQDQLPQVPLRVLLIDDNDLDRELLTRSLELLGHHVLAANDGVSAIDLLLNEDPILDLIVTDFRMPRMNGVETLAGLRNIRPRLPAIICSGSSEWEVLGGQTLDRTVFLEKTFDCDPMGEAIIKVMGDRY